MNTRRSLKAVVAIVFVATLTGAGVVEFGEGFEGRTGWFATPGAGFDHDRGFARTGTGNAWVRNTSGWSAVNAWFNPPGLGRNRECTAQAWIRVSANVTRGIFSVRSERKADGTIPGDAIGEIPLSGGGPVAYRRYSFSFRSTGGPMLLYVGNFGNGRDSWLQVDDVEVSCGRFSY